MQSWSSDGTRLERTGWRDETVSRRHRLWGFDCPCTDIDFLLIEYHIAEPVALIEYKNHQAGFPNLNQAGYRALKRLAEKAQLPLLLAFYWPDIWAFRIYPLNALAKKHFATSENLCERDYVVQLHRMRRLVLSQTLMKNLNTIYPPQED